MRHSVWGNARSVPNRMLEKQPQDQSLPVPYIRVVGLIVGLLLFLFLLIRVCIAKPEATQIFFGFMEEEVELGHKN